MNPKQRNRVIVLVVLGVIVVFLLWWQIFRETPEQRAYRENYERSRTQTATATVPGAEDAGASEGAPAAPPAAEPGAAPEPAPAAPAGGQPAVGGSKFQQSDVNIDELIAGIKEVDFDYDEVAADINPMTPLVGPFAPPRVATTEGAAGEGPAIRQDVQALVRNIRVTGIMWDARDPMAVVSFPVQGEQVTEIVTRGYAFPDMGVTVHDIETDRVKLNINGMLVPIELEER
ncbi:MAG: hypothetical protein IT364_09860 [Candidatus Hydrogenedentes bacterium]|nr:hypothetical protein [Candidatus Hydrogenedentota bacterium]